MGPTQRLVAAASFAVLFGVASAAHAQSASEKSVVAQTLFDQGQQLMQEGRYAEACAKFLSSHRIERTPGTVINLANCYEKNGQTASAWARYVETAELAGRENQRERETFARDKVKELQPKLAKLTIEARELGEGAVVQRDGAAVDSAVFGSEVPIDPGEHTVAVIVNDKKVWSATVQARPASVSKVVVPALPTPKPVEKKPDPAPKQWPWQKSAALVSAGIGVVGVGLGAFFGLKANGEWSDAKNGCEPAGCGDGAIAMGRDARTHANIATVAFIAGGVAIAGAGVLWLVPTADPRTGSAGLTARGRF